VRYSFDCARCGATFATVYVDARGAAEPEPESTLCADCTNAGTCLECGEGLTLPRANRAPGYCLGCTDALLEQAREEETHA